MRFALENKESDGGAMRGWVSIHRKIMNNPVWQDPKLLKLWMLCLLEASHKEHEQLVGRQIIKLLPGQFITGRFALAKAYNEGAKKSDVVPESTLWRWLKRLEENDFVNIKTSTKFSVVTILNWNQYQLNEQQMNNKNRGTDILNEKSVIKSEQQNNLKNHYVSNDSTVGNFKNEQQMNNKWTANEQQMNTNNNGNNDNNFYKEEEEENLVKRILDFLQKSKIVEAKDITEFLLDDINDVIQTFNFEDPEEMIIEAIKDSARGNGKTWKYVYIKLNAWRKDGIKSVAELRTKDGASNVYPINRRSNGKAKSESKPKPEPIFGDFVGRLPRKKV